MACGYAAVLDPYRPGRQALHANSHIASYVMDSVRVTVVPTRGTGLDSIAPGYHSSSCKMVPKQSLGKETTQKKCRFAAVNTPLKLD